MFNVTYLEWALVMLLALAIIIGGYYRHEAQRSREDSWWDGFVEGRDFGIGVGYDDGYYDGYAKTAWEDALAAADPDEDLGEDRTGVIVGEQELAAMGLFREPGPGEHG